MLVSGRGGDRAVRTCRAASGGRERRWWLSRSALLAELGCRLGIGGLRAAVNGVECWRMGGRVGGERALSGGGKPGVAE